MTRIDRDTVLAALRAEDVAAHLGIVGQWRGQWMRSARCGSADHNSDAFGLKRDGHWRCWACDKGGDLLGLVAAGAGLDARADFPAVLALAAQIAGLAQDEWGAAARPAPIARAPLPPPVPLTERINIARRRAAWAWARLFARDEAQIGGRRAVMDLYLDGRGLEPDALHAREELRQTPLRCTMQEVAARPELKSLAYLFAAPGVALPVRAVDGDHLVDIRVRRFEPRPDQPKIVGMLGGVTAGPAELGRPRQLVGCYGRPAMVDADLVVVVEGALDYLTALQVWPNAQVLGAVESGSIGLVARHAARALAARDKESRLVIVEQYDPPRTLNDGRVVAGAADASINEDPTSAGKRALAILGPRRVGWLLCSSGASMEHGGRDVPVKDLNDLWYAGAAVEKMPMWLEGW